MKATKKIIGAASALVVAVALSAGSTFAWFATNDTVTATGMQVQTAVQKNLIIANNAEGTDAASTVESTFTGVQTMSPSSVATLAGSQNFFKATNNTGVDYTTGAASDGTVFGAASVATSLNGDGAADVVKHSFYIKSTSESYSTLYVSGIAVTRNDTQSEISKALRVGVVCGTNGYIYAPVEGATATYYAINKADTVASVTGGTGEVVGDTGSMSQSVTALTAYQNTSVLADTVSSDAFVQVDIYIWYEGQDPACSSANSVVVESLQISVSFGVVS